MNQHTTLEKTNLNERLLIELMEKLEQYATLHQLAHGETPKSNKWELDVENIEGDLSFYDRWALLRQKRYKVVSRAFKIVPQFIGMSFEVHNGKTFVPLTIAEEMVGHRFGEFSSTRKATVHKVIKKK
jgi:ribosomal protein S19